MSSDRTLRSKNRTGLIVLVVLAIILMIASIVLAIKFTGEDDWMVPVENNINNPQKSGFACEAVDAPKLYPFASGLVKVSQDRVSYLDLKGNEVYGEVIDMQTPFCVVSSDKALIADSNGYQYIVINTQKVIFKSTTLGTIDYASINDEGYVAIVTDEPGVKGVVKIIGPDGNGLFSWQSAESGYVLSAKINSDMKRVDISIANTDGTSISPVIKSFGIDGSARGQYLPQINNLMPNLLYDKSGNIILYGSSNILAFDGLKQLYELSFAKIYTAQSSQYGILIVAKIKNEDIPMVFLIDKNGKLSDGIKLSDEFSCIAVKNKYAFVGYGNTILTIALDDFKEKSKSSISAPPIRLSFSTNANQIIVVARDGVTTCIP